MFKKIIVIILLVGISGMLIFGAVNRSLAKVNSEGSFEDHGISITLNTENGEVVERNRSAQESVSSHTAEPSGLLQTSQDGLSEAEEAGLLYMREEEKLAHDVYSVFHSMYGTQNFQNISQSELTHVEAVKALMDRYELFYPASSEMGVFSNSELQALYNEFISTGSRSLADALKVGAMIEETDILDLQERMAQTDNADVQQVYQSLMDGSENHLRVFVAKYLRETGLDYEPQYLSFDWYNAIINADTRGSVENQGAGAGNGGYRNGRP